MRSLIIAACAALLFAAGAPAQAQPSDLSGTWSFQTSTYGSDTTALSGTAIFTRTQGGAYRVRLLAQELHQDYCEARASGARVTITCTVVDTNSSTYAPDNFELTREGDGSLAGDLISAQSSQIVFRRVQ
ncbi:MAG: hypothetical protein K2X34_12890 [Hyphomonadaceae bacterium]|nr:hypothetical protein [Hyphomonadaceae bacterium]